MLTLLYDTLSSRGYSASDLSRLNILEIGGGYGNQLHMILQAIGFKSYSKFAHTKMLSKKMYNTLLT